MTVDTVKVSTATAASTNEGVELRMRTLDGPEVTFLLDDLAISLLGLTLQGCVQTRKAQVGEDIKKVRIFKKEGDK